MRSSRLLCQTHIRNIQLRRAPVRHDWFVPAQLALSFASIGWFYSDQITASLCGVIWSGGGLLCTRHCNPRIVNTSSIQIQITRIERRTGALDFCLRAFIAFWIETKQTGCNMKAWKTHSRSVVPRELVCVWNISILTVKCQLFCGNMGRWSFLQQMA
jgi:hypothetical protein